MGGASALQNGNYGRQRLVAALALLQPGIDPVFLVLLTALNGLALADHGLVVASNQIGVAAGAVLVAFVRHLSPSALRIAALGALATSLLTVAATSLEALLAIRAVFGICNGVLYAAALAAAARRDPAHAVGTVLLYQSVLATAFALVLPYVASRAGPGMALALLAGVAAANLVLMNGHDLAESEAPPAAALPILSCTGGGGAAAGAAVFLFICGTMMIWSYVGAGGLVAGLSNETIGLGVALGSLAGGTAAWLVARGALHHGRPIATVLGGGLAALAMLSPLAMSGSAGGFIAVMILFNLGANYAMAQFSAQAIARSDRMRRLVPALHGGGMIIGPAIAAVAVRGGSFASLAGAAAAALGLAVVGLAIDARQNRSKPDTAPQQKDSEVAVYPLDVNLTAVQS